MRRLAPVLLLLACGPDLPIPADGSTSDIPGSSSAPSPTNTSDSPATTNTPTTASTSVPDDNTSMTLDPPATTSTTTGEPTLCGPACAELRDITGNLEIEPGTDPQTFACVRRIDGDLEIHDMSSGDILVHLGNLEEVTGGVTIRDNAGLTDVRASAACAASAPSVFKTTAPSPASPASPASAAPAASVFRTTAPSPASPASPTSAAPAGSTSTASRS